MWITYCRVDVIQRTVLEGFKLSAKALLHLCRNISTGKCLSRGLGKLSVNLAWMTAARAVLALHHQRFNALFSAARATIANRCL